jgi:ribosomal protein S18 acetylase RimI-like enzyme
LSALQIEWPISTAIAVTDAPAIPGLIFRRFRGEVDYPAMVAVLEGSKEADGLERVDTVDDIARTYRHLVNSDPYQDMLVVEVRGGVIGYSRVWWEQEVAGQRLYAHFAHLLPAWRGLGIRRAMLRHNERRLREIADTLSHLPGSSEASRKAVGAFDVWAAETEAHWISLLASEGYTATRQHLEMVRPDLEGVPDLPLPDGLEVRPVQPDQFLQVRDAADEAFYDHWGQTESQAQRFLEWQGAPTFRPDLWQVAWDGLQVAGGVLNYVDRAENREYDRLRGHTENVFVRRPWRRRGLARALVARSLRMLAELGLEEAALGVDADNPNGARRLYEDMGFRAVKRHTTYRKSLQ